MGLTTIALILIKHSLSFELYHWGKQIGFASIISDFSTMAYLGDEKFGFTEVPNPEFYMEKHNPNVYKG